MSALFYRLLGQAVWIVVVRYLRWKNGPLLLPRKAVAGGGALALAVVLVGLRARSGDGGRAHA
jgi:hypothetical protein